MPDQTVINAAATESAFIGLNSYTEAQAKSFFGRDTEIDQVTNLVETNTLTIVFGKSGTGKTSLLNAGVFPRLRKKFCLPFRIRLEFQADSPGLVTQIKNVLKTEIDKYGFNVEHYPGEETLWEYFHTEPLWKSVTPILVFDQFEEIFTLAQQNDRFRTTDFPVFFEEMSDVIENNIPEKLRDVFLHEKEKIRYNYKTQKVKVVFSFREEYLPEFESVTAKIPSIKLSRFRLMQMNKAQAHDVVSRSWGDRIKPSQTEKIITYFEKDTVENQPPQATFIEPSLLSQVCTYIEKERIESGSETISSELLDKYPKETILREIYNESMAESNAKFADPALKHGKKQPEPMTIFVQEKLITDEGYRSRYTLTESDLYQLMPGIDVLERKYFLRVDDGTVELTHDVLAPLIKTDRDNRLKKVAAVEAGKKARKRGLIILLSLLLAGLVLFLIFWLLAQQAMEQAETAREQADSAREQANFAKKQADSIMGVEKKKKDTVVIINTRIQYLLDSLAGINTGNKPPETLQLRKTEDSLNNALKKLKADYDFLQNKVISLQNQLIACKNSRDDNKPSNGEIQNLKNKLAESERRLKLSQENFNRCIMEKQALCNCISPPSNNPAPVKPNGTHLLLDIKNKNKGTAPANLKIYMVPEDSNRNVIRDASEYEIGCSQRLSQAKGIITADYFNGQYFSNRIEPGKKYFVKICSYYGGFVTFTRKAGFQKVSIELSPPTK